MALRWRTHRGPARGSDPHPPLPAVDRPSGAPGTRDRIGGRRPVGRSERAGENRGVDRPRRMVCVRRCRGEFFQAGRALLCRRPCDTPGPPLDRLSGRPDRCAHRGVVVRSWDRDRARAVSRFLRAAGWSTVRRSVLRSAVFGQPLSWARSAWPFGPMPFRAPTKRDRPRLRRGLRRVGGARGGDDLRLGPCRDRRRSAHPTQPSATGARVRALPSAWPAPCAR